MLIFDLDYTVTLDEAISKCIALGVEPTWACTTSKGVHVAFTLSNAIQYNWPKVVKYARDVKKAVTSALHADVLGSHRLKGIWRNPLRAKEFYFSELLYRLDDFKHIITQEERKSLTLDQTFEKEIKPRKTQNYGLKEGNRNNYVWYNTMRETKSKDFDKVFEVAKSLNQGALELDEVERIARSVLKYNLEDKNHIGAAKVWNWDGYIKKDEGEVMATRRERALLNAEKRAKEAKAKVLNCVTGLMSSEYKKKNGDWNVAKIAKDMRLSRTTVYKYLKEYKLEQGLA